MKLSKLLLVLVGIGAMQVAIGDTCPESKANQGCKKIKAVINPVSDCLKYYEVYKDGTAYQCKKGIHHACVRNKTATCEQPAAQ